MESAGESAISADLAEKAFVMPYGAASAAHMIVSGPASDGVYALIASSNPAMPKMLIIRLRL